MFVFPAAGITMALLFYDLRVRSEGAELASTPVEAQAALRRTTPVKPAPGRPAAALKIRARRRDHRGG